MRLCAICFSPLERYAVKYCSNDCRYTGQKKDDSTCVTCGNPLPPFAIKFCCVKCRQLDEQTRPRPNEPLGPVTVNTPSDLWRLRRANLRHLLDLKRAGHSPTRTELVIRRRFGTK